MKNRLKELRKEHGLTLKEVSCELDQNKVKISPDALAKYERGDREPKLETWEKLANFFEVSVPYLQGLDQENNVKNTKRRLTMTEQQKQVLTAIAGFMLSAAYKIDQIETENEKEKSDGVGMIVSGVSQLVERFGLDEDEMTAKAGIAIMLDSVFENFDTEASNFMDELRKNLNGEN